MNNPSPQNHIDSSEETVFVWTTIIVVLGSIVLAILTFFVIPAEENITFGKKSINIDALSSIKYIWIPTSSTLLTICIGHLIGSRVDAKRLEGKRKQLRNVLLVIAILFSFSGIGIVLMLRAFKPHLITDKQTLYGILFCSSIAGALAKPILTVLITIIEQDIDMRKRG